MYTAPPSTQAAQWEEALGAISESVELTQSHGKFSNIVLLGDLNLRDVNWNISSSDDFSVSSGVKGRAARVILKWMEEQFMEQLICDPTRNNSLLDVVMSNNPVLFSHHEVMVHPRLSDHSLIM